MTHTPGPWVAKGRYIGVENHMSYIAECRDYNGNWTNAPMAVANARLIAAAPDLLEAMKEAKNGLRYWEPQTAHGASERARICALVDAAIAKAEGRS